MKCMFLLFEEKAGCLNMIMKLICFLLLVIMMVDVAATSLEAPLKQRNIVTMFRFYDDFYSIIALLNFYLV